MKSGPNLIPQYTSFAFALGLLAVVAWLNLRHAARTRDAERWVAHTQQVRYELRTLLSEVQEVEATVRGYVVAGTPEFLQSYDNNLAAVAAKFRELRALLADNPAQARALDRLEQLTARRIAISSDLVQLRRDRGFIPAQAVVASGVGMAAMDAVRAQVASMDAEETKLLAGRTAATRREADVARAVTVAGSTVSFVILFGVFALVVRENRLRRRANAALTASETRYRSLFESIDEGYCTIEVMFDEREKPVDYRFLEINPAFEKQTGLKDALGRTMRELAPLHEAHWFEIYGRIALTGEPARFQNRAEQLGRSFDVYAFRLGKPEARQVAIIFNDITARLEAEAALQASQENLAVTLQSIGDGVLATHADGTVSRLNTVAELLTGWTQAEARNQPVEEVFRIINEATRQPAVIPVSDTLKQGTIHGLANHTVLIARDGTERPIADSCAPIRDRAGNVIGAVLVFRDVTKENEAARALRASQRELAAAVRANELIMEHSLDVICTIDGAGRFAFVSAACQRVWGYAPEELVGRQYIEFVHPEDWPITNQAAADIMAGRPVRDFENRYQRKDGELVPIVWSATWSPTSQLMFCVAHDISSRKRSEEDLKQAHDKLARANAELDRASKLKDEFLANMSHELRTPLNAILGLSEALLEQVSGPLTPRQVKSITTVATSGQHLLALINDILDLSKIEAGRLELRAEPVPVAEFCQECLAFVRTQAMHKQISVAFELEGSVAGFRADPRRLKQALVNLLTNAVKFTPQGGRIGLQVVSSVEEELVRFTVWDTGVGIAAVDIAKLFQPFTQIDSGPTRAQEGTGLGLALVARLVELHGGSVSLESAPDQGSRFTVTLPLPAQAGLPATTSTGTPFDAVPASPRILRRALIIEDDPTTSDQLERYLAGLGLSAVVHPDGADAVEVTLREQPDVILLDIMLPRESGWVALAKLKDDPRTRDIPVGVISIVDEPENSHVLGASAHFTKPISRAQLTGFLHGPAGGAPAPAQPDRAAMALSRPLILLAEDNEANVQTIGGYLSERGFAVCHAINGLLAIQLARERKPALILMDIQMPVMDGLTAIREIRADEEVRNTPIVALTALAMPGDRERCLAAGATDYMSKPVSLKSLRAVVTRLVSKPRPPSVS